MIFSVLLSKFFSSIFSAEHSAIQNIMPRDSVSQTLRHRCVFILLLPYAFLWLCSAVCGHSNVKDLEFIVNVVAKRVERKQKAVRSFIRAGAVSGCRLNDNEIPGFISLAPAGLEMPLSFNLLNNFSVPNVLTAFERKWRTNMVQTPCTIFIPSLMSAGQWSVQQATRRVRSVSCAFETFYESLSLLLVTSP